MLKSNILQSGIESDSMDQLQNKLKRYTNEIESLRGKGIGMKTKDIYIKSIDLFFVNRHR